jgi:hypothetical protein
MIQFPFNIFIITVSFSFITSYCLIVYIVFDSSCIIIYFLLLVNEASLNLFTFIFVNPRFPCLNKTFPLLPSDLNLISLMGFD